MSYAFRFLALWLAGSLLFSGVLGCAGTPADPMLEDDDTGEPDGNSSRDGGTRDSDEDDDSEDDEPSDDEDDPGPPTGPTTGRDAGSTPSDTDEEEEDASTSSGRDAGSTFTPPPPNPLGGVFQLATDVFGGLFGILNGILGVPPPATTTDAGSDSGR